MNTVTEANYCNRILTGNDCKSSLQYWFVDANKYLVLMNFLAHAYLSGTDDKILVGNFIADFVKGRHALSAFEGNIRTGIELHRAIDFFTDSHPVVGESKNRLKSKYRHYAGVIVDVFYDHYLARDWTQFSKTPLDEFANRTYSIIQSHHDTIPPTVSQLLPYMIRGNWLFNYRKAEGIARALTGLSRRTPYESKMDEAVQDMIRYDEEFRNEFHLFFPLLREHASNFLTERGLA